MNPRQVSLPQGYPCRQVRVRPSLSLLFVSYPFSLLSSLFVSNSFSKEELLEWSSLLPFGAMEGWRRLGLTRTHSPRICSRSWCARSRNPAIGPPRSRQEWGIGRIGDYLRAIGRETIVEGGEAELWALLRESIALLPSQREEASLRLIRLWRPLVGWLDDQDIPVPVKPAKYRLPAA